MAIDDDVSGAERVFDIYEVFFQFWVLESVTVSRIIQVSDSLLLSFLVVEAGSHRLV